MIIGVVIILKRWRLPADEIPFRYRQSNSAAKVKMQKINENSNNHDDLIIIIIVTTTIIIITIIITIIIIIQKSTSPDESMDQIRDREEAPTYWDVRDWDWSEGRRAPCDWAAGLGVGLCRLRWWIGQRILNKDPTAILVWRIPGWLNTSLRHECCQRISESPRESTRIHKNL